MFQDLDDPAVLLPASGSQRQATVARGTVLRRRRHLVQAAIPVGLVVLAAGVLAIVTTPTLGSAPLPVSPVLPSEAPRPTFGADTLIAVQADDVAGGGPGLLLMKADGSASRPLSPDGACGGPKSRSDSGCSLTKAAWSPDGLRLAFVATTTDGQSLWVADVDGSNPEQVIDCAPRWCDAPAWSPDGRSLIFMEYVDSGAGGAVAENRLVVVDLASRVQRVVATGTDPAQCWRNPRWAPDGESVVLEMLLFADQCGSASFIGSVIAVAPTTGPASTTPTILTDPGLNAEYPDWHPSEDLIVFSTYDPLGSSSQSCFGQCGDSIAKPSNLYTIGSDGTGLRQITFIDAAAGRATMPSWTPDGRWVSFVDVEITGSLPTNSAPSYAAHVAFVDRDGAGLTTLAKTSPPDIVVRFPRVQPGG